MSIIANNELGPMAIAIAFHFFAFTKLNGLVALLFFFPRRLALPVRLSSDR